VSNPTLTANSPVAGSIAWTSFHIVYNGVDYSIPAGNSSHVYTWWPYNGGAGGALQTSDVQPNLGVDDLLLFINKNGIPINVQNAGLIDGDLLVNGTLAAAALIAGTISTREMGVDSVNAGAILAGSVATSELAASAVTADKISAGAVTTDKLTVASLVPDTVPNGTFEDLDSGGAIIGWEADPDVNAASAFASYTTSPINGARSLGLTSINAGNAGVRSKYLFPVRAGDVWVLGVSAGSVANVSGTVLRVYWLDKTGTKLAAPNDKTDIALGGLTNVAAAYSGQVTAPAGAAYMRPAIASLAASAATTVVADDVVAMRVVVSAYIADGAISTPKLAAGSVTASVLAANAVTAGKINAGAIDGMTITGALIRTAASGRRIEITSTSYDTIEFYTGVAGEQQAGALQVLNSGLTLISPILGSGWGYSYINVGTATQAGAEPYVEVFFGGTNGGLFYVEARTVIEAISAATVPLTVQGFDTTQSVDLTQWQKYPGAAVTAKVTNAGLGSFTGLTTSNGITVTAGTTDLSGSTTLLTSGTLPGAPGGGVYVYAYIRTDGSTGVNGRVYRGVAVSSSRVTKQDIQPYELDVDRLLALTPEAFRYKIDVENREADAPWNVGLMGEDVIGHFPELVHVDEDGEIVMVHYDKIGLLTLPVIKDLRERVAALEAAAA